MTRIILVRHGQSTFNAEKRFQGCCDDAVLTETGRLTAYQTGLALNFIPFDAVYVSPLQRTQETAQEMLSAITAFRLKLDPPSYSDQRIEPHCEIPQERINPTRWSDSTPPVHLHPNLKEVHLPQWQGLSYQDVRSRFADDYQQWQDSPHLFHMPLKSQEPRMARQQTAIATLASAPTTFSPLHQLYAQAERFWREILPKYPDQNLLVVSHGGTIRALISTAIGLDISRYHMLQQSNSGISVLTFAQPQQPAQLQALNLTHHLQEVLPKLKNGKQGMRMVLLPVDQEECDITALVTRLQSIPLDVCITNTSDRSQMITRHIFSQYPQPVVQLQVSQPDFLQQWHRSIDQKSPSRTGISTVLAILDVNQINQFLHQILGLAKHAPGLTLKPGTISVLYYPAATNHPVLQAMNLGTDAIGCV